MCMCRQQPVAMYIARLDDQYVVKRMPLSGREHDPACPSYEPPYELSGLGPLIGGAIQIDASGKADLKLDFSLTKRGLRAASGAPTEQSEQGIRSDHTLGLACRRWRDSPTSLIVDFLAHAVDRLSRIRTVAGRQSSAIVSQSIMKPEKKPFVVEFKNRRRLPRKETSIWGRIDLKAAGDAISAEEMVNEGEAIANGPTPKSEATPNPATIIA